MTQPHNDAYPVWRCKACGARIGYIVDVGGERALMTLTANDAPIKSFAAIATCPRCGEDQRWNKAAL